MAIIVGNENPRVYGGIDTINSGGPEVKVDPAEKNEGLKDIDNVEVQKPEVQPVAEEPEEKKPKATTRKKPARSTSGKFTKKSK